MGVCVYCGTERPAAVELCPSCGRAWVDERVATSVDQPAERDRTAGRTLSEAVTTTAGNTTSTGSGMVIESDADDASASASDGVEPVPDEPEAPTVSAQPAIGDQPTVVMKRPATGARVATPAEAQVHTAPAGGTHGGGDEPATSPGPPVRWWVPVGIAVLVLAVYGVIFAVLLSRTGEDVAAIVTTTTAAPTTTAVDQPTSTTVPQATTSSTTSTTTSTTSTTTTLVPIPASGEPVALGDLRLGAGQLGPLRFGEDGDAAGILVSTFGQPDTYFAIGEESGLCPTETGRAVLWGPLTAIFRDGGDTEVLVGYVLDADAAPGRSHPAEQLRTLSGIGLGDSTDDIDNAYGNVSYEQVDGADAYLVLSSEDGRTLVWGVLSGDDPPVIRSIASPRACDGGPFSTG